MPEYFIDDLEIQRAIDEASHLAIDRLARLLPTLKKRAEFEKVLRQQLETLLTRQTACEVSPLVCGHDAFGDPFSLAQLPLARPGIGYAVQRLGSDTLLDRNSRSFLRGRDPKLAALFESFDLAYTAAKNWLKEQNSSTEETPLAIVPATYDTQLQRHILIYGVLSPTP